MSDYQETDELPLFRQPVNTIEQHEPPDTAELEERLIQQLMPTGSSHVIEGLRHSFYSRVETIARRLRQKGHGIDTIDGCYIYRHGSPAGWTACPKGLAEQYRSTRHWKTLSAQRIEMDGDTCTQCRRRKPDIRLNAHHWRYNLFEENVQHDLQTFCEGCHRSLHIVLKGSGIMFPKFLNSALIERIEKEAGGCS